MEIYAEDVSVQLSPFGGVPRKRTPFLGEPGQNPGEYGGVYKQLV
jgi:hypothetical protein